MIAHEESDAVSEAKHRHGNSTASLKCARVYKSIIYYNTQGYSSHLQVIPQQSTQNTANLPLQTYEENQPAFFFVQHKHLLELSQ